MKIVYCTPSLYIAGGVERVLSIKANYFAEVLHHDIYIILTDGKGKEPYYPLSPKIKIIQLDINFEELWKLSFIKKIPTYLKKQRIYRKLLREILFDIRPDITISLLRREINFINEIKDGSIKIGELHVNRDNYRNFESNESNIFKDLFAKIWMKSLINKLKKLDRFVVLSKEDSLKWNELKNIEVIPNPLSFEEYRDGKHDKKIVIAVGRYVYQKGFDLLLYAWQKVQTAHPDWTLCIYGNGNKLEFQKLVEKLDIGKSCLLNSATSDIMKKYGESSIFVLSSRFEGFGMVITEAMNCGTPAISFRCPCGPSEIISHQEDGILVENGNTEELANAICYLIANTDIRKEMGNKAIVNVQRFHIKELAHQWESLFKSIHKKECYHAK